MFQGEKRWAALRVMGNLYLIFVLWQQIGHKVTGGNSLSAVGPAAFTKTGRSEILGSE